MGKRRAFSSVVDFLERQSYLERGGGASAEEVRKLESEWGAELPEDYRDFLVTFGWVAFGTTEIPGLGQRVPKHLDIQVLSSSLWEETKTLPKGLLPIYDSGGGWYYCLSKYHPGMPVVVWSLEFGTDQPYDERYKSWTDWFLDYLAAPI